MSVNSMPPPPSPVRKAVVITDHRTNGHLGEFTVDATKFSWEDLFKYIIKKKRVPHGKFSLALPGHVPLTEDEFNRLRPGRNHIWLLDEVEQKLTKPVRTTVRFDPHYNTIVESGMYEYYDSRGIDSLVIALAELIDNSLWATKKNQGLRHIEIRYFDNGNDSMLMIIDNGRGMSIKGLNDWATFKLSRFERTQESNGSSGSSQASSLDGSFSSQDLPLRRDSFNTSKLPDPEDRRPRYLDSGISFFGAGGKQAIFNTGQDVTMITKTKETDETYEMTLSKKRFEERTRTNPEGVYEGVVVSRALGVDREVNDNTVSELILNKVAEEMEKECKSFTICCIKEMFDRHKDQFGLSARKREDPKFWAKQLAWIYHYYLHGPKGSVPDADKHLPSDLKNINIVVRAFNVRPDRTRPDYELNELYSINLGKDIDDDYESLLVKTAADTYEFEVEHMDVKLSDGNAPAVIEGIVRYHPFLSDHETKPRIHDDIADTESIRTSRTNSNIDHLTQEIEKREIKPKHKEVFECFWHGRLIPQDCIDFDWNLPNAKSKDKIPEECFDRLSGALFTNSAYKVSQNKQSFMNLTNLMAKKDHLTFYKLCKDNPNRRLRIVFENDVMNWLKECHKKYDKQIHYRKFLSEANRKEFPALAKNSLSDTYWQFEEIEWNDRILKKGDIIQTQKTKPNSLIGRIDKFLVPVASTGRDDAGNYMGPPGFIDIYQLPAEVYGNEKDASKLLSFRQIKLDATTEAINQELDKSFNKLPATVKILFPEWDRITGQPIVNGSELIAGQAIPDIQIQLFNANDVKLENSRIPFKNTSKPLKVQLEILRVEVENGREETLIEIQYPVAEFSKDMKTGADNDFWFLRNEKGITKVGKYRIKAVCLAFTGKNWEGMQVFANNDPLPAADDIDFFVVAGPAKHFTVVETDPEVLIGVPFTLTLQFFDEYDNPANIEGDWLPILAMDGFHVIFANFDHKQSQLILKDITIVGLVGDVTEQTLELALPSLNHKQKLKINLKKGSPTELRLVDDNQLEFINGSRPLLPVQLFDKGGNDVTFDHPLPIFAEFIENDAMRSSRTGIFEQLLKEIIYKDTKRCLAISEPVTIKKRSDLDFNHRKFFVRYNVKSHPSLVLEKEVKLMRLFKPTSMRLFFTNPGRGDVIEIPNGVKRQFPVGSCLVSVIHSPEESSGAVMPSIYSILLQTGVHFKVYDSDDSELDLSEYIEYTVKMTWHNKPHPIDRDGTLPNIVVHRDSTEERLLTLFFKIVKKDIDVEHNFYLKPYPDKPERMVIESGSHQLKFLIGKVVPEALHIKVYDAFNNVIRSQDMLTRLSIRPVSERLKIDSKSLEKKIPLIDGDNAPNSISFVVSHIKLVPNQGLTETDTVFGETRLEFSLIGFEAIKEFLKIEVVGPQTAPKTPVKQAPVPHKVTVSASGLLTRTAKTNAMPPITARIFSEDDRLIENFDPNKVEMHFFLASDPNNYQVFKPNKNDCIFRFRLDMAPDPGVYKIKIVVDGPKKIEETLASNITIVPGAACELVERSANPVTTLPIVVNVNELVKPLFTSDLNLILVDKNGFAIAENVSEAVAEDCSGGVYLRIIRANPDQDGPLPELQGCDQERRLHFNIRRGRVLFNKMVRVDPPSATGAADIGYFLEFAPYLESDPRKSEAHIKKLLVGLTFCDNSERQTQLLVMQNELSTIQSQWDEYKEKFNKKEKEFEKHDKKVKNIETKEKSVKDRLQKCNEKSDLRTSQAIVAKIKEYERLLNEAKRLQNGRPVRNPREPLAPEIEGVVGKVAHMAYVEDNACARSLSYYMKNMMNCVVAKNSKMAKKLREEHECRLTASMDTFIKQYKLHATFYYAPDSRLALRHDIDYAISKFEFNDLMCEPKEDLKRAFLCIIGDTLYTDSLRNAEEFRLQCDRHLKEGYVCPTIVTKEGIIYSSGVIDTAVPKEDGHCVSFQPPPNKEYVRVSKCLQLLTELKKVSDELNKESEQRDRLKEELDQIGTELQKLELNLDSGKKNLGLKGTNQRDRSDRSDHKRRHPSSSSRYSSERETSHTPKRHRV